MALWTPVELILRFGSITAENRTSHCGPDLQARKASATQKM